MSVVGQKKPEGPETVLAGAAGKKPLSRAKAKINLIT